MLALLGLLVGFPMFCKDALVISEDYFITDVLPSTISILSIVEQLITYRVPRFITSPVNSI